MKEKGKARIKGGLIKREKRAKIEESLQKD